MYILQLSLKSEYRELIDKYDKMLIKYTVISCRNTIKNFTF